MAFTKKKQWRLPAKSFYAIEKKEYGKSRELAKEGLELARRTDSKIALAFALQYDAFFYWATGQLDTALNMAFEALKIGETAGNLKNIAWCSYTLGVFYFDLKDYETALQHYNKALTIIPDPDKEIYGRARCYSGIGSVYIKQEQYEKALEYITAAQKVYEELEHSTGMSRAFNDMGLVCRELKKYAEAEQYLLQSLAIRQHIRHTQGITTTEIELGSLYLEQKKYEEALQHLNEALAMAEQTGTKSKIYQVHELLSILYKLLNEPWKALENTEKFFRIRAEVLGLEATNKISQLEIRYAKEKAEQEAELQRLRHVELKAAYEEIEQKNKDIADSISYARRIQRAILPAQEHISELFPQSFILYKPKDVVAGDFYWMETNGDWIFIAAADCTGHGVPGAMVSVVCSNALNRSVKEFGHTEPGLILDKTTDIVLETFAKSDSSVRDGMDISLLAINRSKHIIQWAGAHNPLWTVNGELKEIKADKQPIGKSEQRKPFTTHQLSINKNEIIYLFSDGYADQFGGPEGKKLMTRRFKEILVGIQQLNMCEQETALNKTFEDWKGNHEQVDDVCVIGIKI